MTPGAPGTREVRIGCEFVHSSAYDVPAVFQVEPVLGEIADVVIGFDGKVKAWVVGVGGFLGIGTKYVAVDPSAMHLQRVDGKALRAMINTDKDQLRAAPEYIYLGKEPPKGAAAAPPAGEPAAKP